MPPPIFTRPIQGVAPNQFVSSEDDAAEINRVIEELYNLIGSGGGGGGGGGGAITWVVRGGTTTASAGQAIAADVSEGGWVLSLPEDPTVGSVVLVAKVRGDATLLVSGGGEAIESQGETAASMDIDEQGVAVAFIWTGLVWAVVLGLGGVTFLEVEGSQEDPRIVFAAANDLATDETLTYDEDLPGTVAVGDLVETTDDVQRYRVLSASTPDAMVRTAGGVRMEQTFAPAPPSLGGGIIPEYHLRACSVTTTPKIVIVGDSISTKMPSTSFDESDSFWGQIQRAFREANPHLTPVFVNMAWGGTTWTTLNNTVASEIAAGRAPPEWDYGTGTGTWLSYVQAQNPDLVIFAFGMNDRENLVAAQPRAALNATRTWTKVPDLILVPPMVPSRISSNAAISSEDSQEGRYFTAHWMRTWALRNRYGLLDLNRHYARMVHGVDPRSTYFTADGSSAVTTSLPYTFPRQTDQDIGVQIQGASSLITAGLALSISRVGVNSKSELWIDASGGNVRMRVVDVFNNDGTPSTPFEHVSSVPVPAGDITLRIFVKDNLAWIILNDAQVFSGPIIRQGGRFTGALKTLNGSTPSATLRTYSAKYVRNTPSLSDQQMWGPETIANGIIGGNRLNHPTSMGAAYVFRPLIDAQNWAVPSMAFGRVGFPFEIGNRIGIGATDLHANLHITKSRISGTALPTATANNLVLEDATSAGMSLITNSGGAARYHMGTAAQPEMGGFVLAASTGVLSLRAANAIRAAFVTPGTSQASIQVQVNIAGTTTLKQVTVGAADSAGTGFRTLRVPN